MKAFDDVHVSEILKETDLLCGIPAEDLLNLSAGARYSRVRSGKVIFEKDEVDLPIYLVISGRVKITVPGRSGAELLLGMIETGEIFGEVSLADDAPLGVNAVAQCVCDLAAFRSGDMRRVVDGNEASRKAFSRILFRHIGEAVLNLGNVGLHDAKTRLWLRLIYLGPRYGTVNSGTGELRIDHGLSQQSLADSIGITRVMVNRQLGVWRKQGLIGFGRGFVSIRDPKALEAEVWEEAAPNLAVSA